MPHMLIAWLALDSPFGLVSTDDFATGRDWPLDPCDPTDFPKPQPGLLYDIQDNMVILLYQGKVPNP